MSLYAMIDDRDAGDVATNSGWHDFSSYVATIKGLDELHNLTQYGWADESAVLAEDLQRVIKTNPGHDRASIARGLIAIAKQMKPGEVLVVSDGCGVVEEDDGDDANSRYESYVTQMSMNGLEPRSREEWSQSN